MTLPLHQRIRGDIERDILSGALQPGARLPVEHELMRAYGCSRATVNKALTALTSAGLIDRRKRAGSFVARPKVHSMVLDIPDLEVEVARRGQRYRYALLRRSIRHAATPAETTLAGSGTLLQLDGVHHADGRPLAFEERLISLVAVPETKEVDFQLISPGAWLLRHVPWTEAEMRLAAVSAQGAIAARLDVDPGTACLLVERRTWRGKFGITLVRQYFIGSDYDLVASFGPARHSLAA